MTKVRYQLYYDTEFDADIHAFLESFPSSRKADAVKNAIRLYIQHGAPQMINMAIPQPITTAVAPVAPVNAVKEKEEETQTTRKRPKIIDYDNQ